MRMRPKGWGLLPSVDGAIGAVLFLVLVATLAFFHVLGNLVMTRPWYAR